MQSRAKDPVYLGFDLSTQQLKGIAVASNLKVVQSAVFDFDKDAAGFNVQKGVLTNDAEKEVFAPVAMWLQAIDSVLGKLKDSGLDLSRVAGISGAGQQHGSVYWASNGHKRLRELESSQTLQDQLQDAFAYPYSPNWQDASTQEQCDRFDMHLGNEDQLAKNTGSKAHHRFTGPQILRFREKHPDEYAKTVRISLVSSFLASIFLGEIAPLDISDVCGMNLWDIEKGSWNDELLALAAGSHDTSTLRSQLGAVPEDGGTEFGRVAKYFVDRYGFNPECGVMAFTGDNPSTILALPLRPLDAIVSLGTSTTFLMSTPHYKPDPAVHFFNHPTTAGLYMFMLCYKNGGLAREQVRDSLPSSPDPSEPWANFNARALSGTPLGQTSPTSPQKQALYFPRPEIVPNVQAGVYRYTYTASASILSTDPSPWSIPNDDPRAIIESQFLSLRLRSLNIVAPHPPPPSSSSPSSGIPTSGPSEDLPPQPRRIYLVGGGSSNPAIAKLAGEILGGVEGVYKLDVGGNACALGSAYKAVWACERSPGQTFEDLIGARWDEGEFAEKVADGYSPNLFEVYGKGVKGLELIEKDVLTLQSQKSRKEDGGGDIRMLGTTGAGQIE